MILLDSLNIEYKILTSVKVQRIPIPIFFRGVRSIKSNIKHQKIAIYEKPSLVKIIGVEGS